MDNGDEGRYADKSGTYTKGIRQAGIGLVDLTAYETFIKALSSGDPADFEAIKVGGTGVPGMDYFTQNDPQGGLAFNLDCPDSTQFKSPQAPAVASEEYAGSLWKCTGLHYCGTSPLPTTRVMQTRWLRPPN